MSSSLFVRDFGNYFVDFEVGEKMLGILLQEII